MAVDAHTLKACIDRELEHLADVRVTAHICALLVEPKIILGDWDYGQPGEQYPCWTVLQHHASGTGIVYCEHGFGPKAPWGLVWLGSDDPERVSIGMDCGWYTTLVHAYFNCFASTDLPIWRVFRTDLSGVREPITEEGSWGDTWQRVEQCRNADPGTLYDCDQSIAGER